MSQDKLPFTRAEIDREVIRRNGLYEFVQRAWHEVESAPFVGGPHIELICRHLEAVTLGLCNRLVINIPPGCSKSLLVSVFWPAWHWAMHNGGTKWMHLSFDIGLSLRDSVRCRELITSDWYQDRFGTTAKRLRRPPLGLMGILEKSKSTSKARKAQQSASVYWTSQKGLRFSTMMRGKGLGWHAHIQVCDDPTKQDDVREGGELARKSLKKTRDIWSGTFASRKADPKNFARVVIMQRLHFDDLAQSCIDEGYTALVLPMEYDPDRHCKTPYGEDWRKEKGELLCPDRFDAESLVMARREMGSRVYEAQMQQSPSPDGGSIFSREWFNLRWREIPAGASWFQSWDCTFKKADDTDFVVGQVWAKVGRNLYLVDQIRERMGFVSTCRAVQDMCAKWPESTGRILVEDKANGTAVIDTLKEQFPSLEPVEPKGGKVARASAGSPRFEEGCIYLPEGAPWVSGFIKEHTEFPLGAKDDQVDATSQAIADATTEGDHLGRASEAWKKWEKHVAREVGQAAPEPKKRKERASKGEGKAFLEGLQASKKPKEGRAKMSFLDSLAVPA